MREHAHRVSGGDVYWTISTLPVVLANHTFMAHAHTPCLAFCIGWWGVLWHMLTGSSHLHHLLSAPLLSSFAPFSDSSPPPADVQNAFFCSICCPLNFFDVAQITHESIW